jgi:cell pole-organizing protein PopZ
MEDILASIRRILNEDEAPKPAPEPHEPGHTPDNGVLVLDSSMMVPEPPRDLPPRDLPLRDPPPRDMPSRDVPQPKSSAERPAIQEHPVVPESEPPAPRVPQPPQQSAPVPTPLSKPSSPSGSLLVAPEAAAAAGASVETLMRTLASERNAAVQRGGPTIEDLVRIELRPMLKDWLDNHLPPLVERLVQAEIERVVGRMAP